MALLLLAFTSCTSKPEGEISQTEQQEQESSTTAQSPEEPSTTPEEAAQVQEASGDSEVISVTGTVESGPDGMIISADDGTYAVSGHDLSDMAGMMVQITGALKESEGLRTIEVTDVMILK
jgi:hypothetical protein